MKLRCWILLTACACCSAALAEVAVDTVAGTGAAENNGDAGPALSTNVGMPFGVAIGSDGALYVTEVQHHRVRRLDLKSRELSTVAGSGEKGYSGDGGPAVDAKMNEPYEICFDSDGNMIIVEMQNHIIRRVDRKTKTIATIAGTGKKGFGGDGGPASAAQFSQPHSIAIDRDGAIYVADIGNHRIRRIDPKSGVVETIAGTGERRMSRDGQTARGNPILGPRALCIEGDTLWVALREGHSIWRMNLGDGILHHVAGTGKAGFSGDGGPAAEAKLNGPKGIAIGPTGDVFVADTENNAIRKIDVRTGEISTLAGGERGNAAERSDDSPPAAGSLFNRPHGVCVASDGVVYCGDTLNHRVAKLQ